MDRTQIFQKLARELDLILERNWDPTFTVRKLTAMTENDIEGYCAVLEEELEVKDRTLTELTRAGELSTEIIERLRARIAIDEVEIERLRAEHETLFSDFKKLKEDAETNSRQLDAATGLLADSGADRSSLERLVANLEAENRREAVRANAAEAQLQQTQHDILDLKKMIMDKKVALRLKKDEAAAAARAAAEREAALEARFEHAAAAAAAAQDLAHKATMRLAAAEEQLATLRCAKWATS